MPLKRAHSPSPSQRNTDDATRPWNSEPDSPPVRQKKRIGKHSSPRVSIATAADSTAPLSTLPPASSPPTMSPFKKTLCDLTLDDLLLNDDVDLLLRMATLNETLKASSAASRSLPVRESGEQAMSSPGCSSSPQHGPPSSPEPSSPEPSHQATSSHDRVSSSKNKRKMGVNPNKLPLTSISSLNVVAPSSGKKKSNTTTTTSRSSDNDVNKPVVI